MAARRVFVIWTHPIFRESVRLLLNHPDIEWVGATSDIAIAKDQVSRLRPDTILFEEVEGNVLAGMVELLEASPWHMRIFGLGLVDNQLRVYQREELTICQPEDLLQLIRGESPEGGGQ
jgi:DNA-binding NarL/FixJ family response regulator